jgi:LPXTG-motif cell wall-anchored protein
LKQSFQNIDCTNFSQKIFKFILNSQGTISNKINTKVGLSSNTGGNNFLIFLLLAILMFLGLSLFLYRSKIRKILILLLGAVDKEECFSIGEKQKSLETIQKLSKIQKEYEKIKLELAVKLNQKTIQLVKLLGKHPFKDVKIPEAFMDLIEDIFNIAQNFVKNEQK